jgi:cation diffusion facilitator family transporter
VAVAVMVVSIVLTAGLVAAQTRALRQVSSVAVSGDRMHYMADLGSNFAGIVGLVVVWATGWGWLDATVGLFIAAWLVWGAVGVLREGADQLMDHELPAAERARVLAVAADDPQVRDVHELRTRMAGPTLHMQMHMDLDPELTLEAAHRIVQAAEDRLRAAWPHADVLIHPDPEGHAEDHAPIAEPAR